MKKYIYLIECDFCFDKNIDLFFVEFQGEPTIHAACMKCIKEKGWDKEE